MLAQAFAEQNQFDLGAHATSYESWASGDGEGSAATNGAENRVGIDVTDF